MVKLKQTSVVVGIDTHKYSHTAVAQDIFGKDIAKLTFDTDNLSTCDTWLKSVSLDKSNLVVGIEDIEGNGNKLARYLLGSNYNVVYVPPVLTALERKHSLNKNKSDYLDAKRVGKVILHKSEETLPASKSIAENTVKDLDLLIQERSDLTKLKTAVKNQLHTLLHLYYGNNYKNGYRNIFSKKAIQFFKENVTPTTIGRSVQRKLIMFDSLEQQIKDIDKELNNIASTSKEIQALSENILGCGVLSACKIISEIKTIKRFSNRDKLASYSGTAPVMRSSGRYTRYYTNRGGNRKLNTVIHTIALSQIGNRGSKEDKEYYIKKQKEGKTKLWAMRCLKRRIVNKVYQILSELED